MMSDEKVSAKENKGERVWRLLFEFLLFVMFFALLQMFFGGVLDSLSLLFFANLAMVLLFFSTHIGFGKSLRGVGMFTGWVKFDLVIVVIVASAVFAYKSNFSFFVPHSMGPPPIESPPPTPPPPPQTSLPPDESSEERNRLKAIWEQLQDNPGRIAFPSRREMTQGKPEVVEVRITALEPVELADSALSEGIEGEVEVEEILVTGKMIAVLRADDPEAFSIESNNIDPEQALLGPYATWSWTVIPLKYGKQTLRLTIRAKIGDEFEQDHVFKEAIVSVQVNPQWMVGGFVRGHWKWLLGSPLVLGLFGWIWSRFRKDPEERRAGF